MDLLRSAKSAFEINKPFDKNIANLFIRKALDEFDNNFPQETVLRKELTNFQTQIDSIATDPLKRIRWGEKVMTIASRLGSI